jgi:hypothetical protein
MKGWVYVISNEGKPGIVKVGYSTKDPELRAKELDGTADPYPHLVDYNVLIDDPYNLEQQSHTALADKRISDKGVGTEWFRTSSEEAVAVIRRIAGDKIINEDFNRAKREDVLKLQEIKEREWKAEAENQRKLAARKKQAEAEDQKRNEENQKREKQQKKLWEQSCLKARSAIEKEKEYYKKFVARTNAMRNFLIMMGLCFLAFLMAPSSPSSLVVIMIALAVAFGPMFAFVHFVRRSDLADQVYDNNVLQTVSNRIYHNQDYSDYLLKKREKLQSYKEKQTTEHISIADGQRTDEVSRKREEYVSALNESTRRREEKRKARKARQEADRVEQEEAQRLKKARNSKDRKAHQRHMK